MNIIKNSLCLIVETKNNGKAVNTKLEYDLVYVSDVYFKCVTNSNNSDIRSLLMFKTIGDKRSFRRFGKVDSHNEKVWGLQTHALIAIEIYKPLSMVQKCTPPHPMMHEKIKTWDMFVLG